MPGPGKRWYHATLGTYNSWLPGDPRGFRSRGHKVHSSGHHKAPPPQGEHTGLHAYSRSIAGPPIQIPDALRPAIGDKLVAILIKDGSQVLALSVSAMHAHLLVELPDNIAQAKGRIGVAKKAASQLVKDTIPGRVWARGCGLKPIRDEAHHRNTFAYLCRHADEGAYIWTFRDHRTDEPSGTQG